MKMCLCYYMCVMWYDVMCHACHGKCNSLIHIHTYTKKEGIDLKRDHWPCIVLLTAYSYKWHQIHTNKHSTITSTSVCAGLALVHFSLSSICSICRRQLENIDIDRSLLVTSSSVGYIQRIHDAIHPAHEEREGSHLIWYHPIWFLVLPWRRGWTMVWTKGGTGAGSRSGGYRASRLCLIERCRGRCSQAVWARREEERLGGCGVADVQTQRALRRLGWGGENKSSTT